MQKSYVRVLGSADWHQTRYNDHSCYTVNDHILIDACPSVVTQLQEHGVDPLDIHAVCFTHMHCDHYMGLAPLLHYWSVCRSGDLSDLMLIGPEETLKELVERTLLFVFGHTGLLNDSQTKGPKIIEIKGGANLKLTELCVHTIACDHTVPGLSYCIQDTQTGHRVGFSGDTAYRSEFGAFFQKADLLLYEVSYGGNMTDEKNTSRHSSAYEAAQVAKEAAVRKLLLTHTYEPKRKYALTVAQQILKIPVEWAMPHHIFYF